MQRRMKELYSKTKNYYILSLENGSAIDSGIRGSAARFANHSCSPNAEMQKWYVNGVPRIGLFAIDSIPAGTELTYDYNFDWFEGAEKQVCLCGEPNCRGFIGRRSRKSETQRISPNPVKQLTNEVQKPRSSSPARKLKRKSPSNHIMSAPPTVAKIVKRSPGRPRKLKLVNGNEVLAGRASSKRSITSSAHTHSASPQTPSPLPEIARKRNARKPPIVTDDEDEEDQVMTLTESIEEARNGETESIESERGESHEIDELEIVEPIFVIENSPDNVDSGDITELAVVAKDTPISIEETHSLDKSTQTNVSLSETQITIPATKDSSNSKLPTEETASIETQNLPTPRRRGRPKGSKSKKILPDLDTLPPARVTRSASMPSTRNLRKSQRNSQLDTRISYAIMDNHEEEPLFPIDKTQEVDMNAQLNKRDAHADLSDKPSVIEDQLHSGHNSATFESVTTNTTHVSDSDGDYLTPAEGSPVSEVSIAPIPISSLPPQEGMLDGNIRPREANASDTPLAISVLINQESPKPMSPPLAVIANPQKLVSTRTIVNSSELKGITVEPAESTSRSLSKVSAVQIPTEITTASSQQNASPLSSEMHMSNPRAQKTKAAPTRPLGRPKKGLKKATVHSETDTRSLPIMRDQHVAQAQTSSDSLHQSEVCTPPLSAHQLPNAFQPPSEKSVRTPELPQMVTEPRLVKLDIYPHSFDYQGPQEQQRQANPSATTFVPSRPTNYTENCTPTSEPPLSVGTTSNGTIHLNPLFKDQRLSHQSHTYNNSQHPMGLYGHSFSESEHRPPQEASVNYLPQTLREPHPLQSLDPSRHAPSQHGPLPSLTAAVASHTPYELSYTSSSHHSMPSQTNYAPCPSQYQPGQIPNSSSTYHPSSYSHNLGNTSQPPQHLLTSLPSIHAHDRFSSGYGQASEFQSAYGDNSVTSTGTHHDEGYDQYEQRRFSLPMYGPGSSDANRTSQISNLLNKPLPPSAHNAIVPTPTLDDPATAPRRHSVYQSTENQAPSSFNTDPHNYRLQQREAVGDKSWRQQVSIQSLMSHESSDLTRRPEQEPIQDSGDHQRQPLKKNSISSLVNPAPPSYPNVMSPMEPSRSDINGGNSPNISRAAPSNSISNPISFNQHDSTSKSSFGLVQQPMSLTGSLSEAPNGQSSSSKSPLVSLAPKNSKTPTKSPFSVNAASAQKSTPLTKPKRGRPPNSTRMSLSSPQPIAPLATPIAPSPMGSSLAAPRRIIPQAMHSLSSPSLKDVANSSLPVKRAKKKGRPVKETPLVNNKPRRGRPPNSAPAQRPYLAPLALRPASTIDLTEPSNKLLLGPLSNSREPNLLTRQRPLDVAPVSIAPKPVELPKKRARAKSNDTSGTVAKKPHTLPPILPNDLPTTPELDDSLVGRPSFTRSPVVIDHHGTAPVDAQTPARGRNSSSPRLTVTNAIKAAFGSSRNSVVKIAKSRDSPGSSPGDTQKRGRGRPRTRPKDYWTYNNRKARGEFGPGNFPKQSSSPFSSPSQVQSPARDPAVIRNASIEIRPSPSRNSN